MDSNDPIYLPNPGQSGNKTGNNLIALALPLASLIGSAVNGVSQYFGQRQRKQELTRSVDSEYWNRAHLQAKFDTEQKALKQRDDHHAETMAFHKAQAKAQAERGSNWPLILTSEEYTHNTVAHDRQPLTVMLSPPPENDKDFREVVKDIENELRILLQKNYDANDPKRPVYFLAKAWKLGMVGGEAPARVLHHALHEADAPTLIVDLEMTDRDLRIHTHYWGIGQTNELRDTACDIALPLSEYIAEVARRHARESYQVAMALGKGAKTSEIDERNWIILQNEEKLRQNPQLNPNYYVKDYAFNTEYLREAVREITPALQLLVGCMADLYHLCRYGVAPYLPVLLEGMFKDVKDERVKSLMEQVTRDYSKMMDSLAESQPELGPVFHLEMAEAFSGLTDVRLCESHVLKSLRAWRTVRGAEEATGDAIALLEGIEDKLQREDRSFFGRIFKLLKLIIESLTNDKKDDIEAYSECLRWRIKLIDKMAFLSGRLNLLDLTGYNIHGWPADKVQLLQKETAKALDKSEIFRDTLKSGDEGPEMVVIPAGCFLMGSPSGETTFNPKYEAPQHIVTFCKPYYIGKYAVTFDDYDRFCEATGRVEPKDEDWGRGLHPVINISLDDVRAYCAWLSEQTGHRYRLPSEAEWEYACRAGTVTPFHWGNTVNEKLANYDQAYIYYEGTSRLKPEYERSYVAATKLRPLKNMPVNHFSPNHFGLYQMHGNVWERCEDYWHDSYEGAPDNGCARDCCSTAQRVIRGGSSKAEPERLRSAARAIINDRGYMDIGFRLVRDI